MFRSTVARPAIATISLVLHRQAMTIRAPISTAFIVIRPSAAATIARKTFGPLSFNGCRRTFASGTWTRTDIETQLLRLLNSMGGEYDKSVLEGTIDDLGVDSLQGVKLISDIEDHFSITFPMSDAANMTKVSEVVDFIVKETSAK
ncbi:hypothetical protein BGX33_004151 [Mortierella sp. NVP41]|nr:hypothetical protein BGX33_004151 [Mortierella sp. NVP41]